MGGGYVIYQAQAKIAVENFSINRRVKATDVEIMAVYNSLVSCISKDLTRLPINIIAHTDNKTAIDILSGKTSKKARKKSIKYWKFNMSEYKEIGSRT